MTTTTAIAALLGAGLAGGILLIALGLRRASVPARTGESRWKWRRRPTSRRAVLAALAAGVLAGVLTGWVVGAVLVAVAVGTLPRVLGRDPDHTRRIARIEAIAAWTEMLRDTLSAAAGLEQAILATAGTAPEAIRADIRALTLRIERGDTLASALHELADDLADPTADLVLSALVLASQHRARHLAELLGELATEAREQVAMRLRVEAGRARTRTSVRVIIATTLSFAAALLIFDRSYLTPYDGALGQLMLLIVGALFGVAFWWLGRFAITAEPARVLTNLGARDEQEIWS